MRCARCGADNPPGAVFCLNCGLRSGAAAPPGWTQPVKPNATLSRLSLILGIASVVTLGGFCVMPIASIVLGIIGLVKAKKEPERYSGSGFAISGIILSALTVLIVPAIAIPNLLKSQQDANELSAIVRIRRIATAEATYQSTAGRGRDFGSFEDLVNSSMIESQRITRGYEFNIVANGDSFQVTATPEKYGTFGTGHRSFYVDDRYVICAADHGGLPANADDPPIE